MEIKLNEAQDRGIQCGDIMKVIIEKDESVFIVTITDDIEDEYRYDLIKIRDHDELLSLLIKTLNLN